MSLLEKFAKVRVLVIGDVMLDRYWWGSASRISPEAPVPVVRQHQESLVGGGAANVAANVVGLGAEVVLIGIVGNDPEADLLAETLERSNISAENLVRIENRPTTLKTRVIANHQQVARIDRETSENLSDKDEERVWQKICQALEMVEVVIVSDYAKGLLSDKLLLRLITTASSKNLPILVDPKGKDYQKYIGASLITPNRKEALEACQFEWDEPSIVFKAGEKLLTEFDFRAVLITEGEAGMTLFERGKLGFHLNAAARHVFDVTGAGDTVIATLGVAVGAGIDLLKAAEIANLAAGFVVEEVGTTVIEKDKLENLI
jgi:D-beta-D-heptose 7-phosphate kinase/D-beta-D-heptose 1-phosphate adenosyltransferase